MNERDTGRLVWIYLWVERSHDTGDPGVLLAKEVTHEEVFDLDPRWAGDFRYTGKEEHRYQEQYRLR